MNRYGSEDCFYLTQNYFRILKQGILDNVNFIIIFTLKSKNLRELNTLRGCRHAV